MSSNGWKSPGATSEKAVVFIVMGVSGSGKSNIGDALGRHLHCEYKDGDSLHPQSNIDKMSSGHALTDDDRWPWLKILKDYTTANAKSSKSSSTRPMLVTACSSLKKSYRDFLRDSSAETVFVYLKGSHEILMERMKDRKGHFMKQSMLESQLATLESPEGEHNVLVVSIENDLATVIKDACDSVDSWLDHSQSHVKL